MTFTKEQLIKKAQEQIAFCSHTKITGEGRAHVNQCAALFEIALAALTAKPTVYCMKKGEALDIDAISTCKPVVDAWVDEWNEMQCEHGDDFSAVSLYLLPMVEDLSNDQ
ncbi:hypothetical protein [Raoultella ornithinolytica]|uniref:hypothetical protein n=1 Tax=Raoultella ornithinolytica TaxID=54291 RepID=UPI001BD283A0|nr:hypothetical protein [Raoultella ornithinolytica]